MGHSGNTKRYKTKIASSYGLNYPFKCNADLDTSVGSHSGRRCIVGIDSADGSAMVMLRVSGRGVFLKSLRTTVLIQEGIAYNPSASHCKHATDRRGGPGGMVYFWII